MTCSLGPKKLKKLREKTGLDIIYARVRGGSDHRVILFVSDGATWHLHKDGTLEKHQANPIYVKKWNES